MSDFSQGPGWWQASDGMWYPPHLKPQPSGGYPLYPSPYGYPQPRSTNGLAIASLVLGILWIYWIGSILAVIFGHVALSQIKKDPSSVGRGLAIAGLVLGYIGVATLAVVIVIAIGLNSATWSGRG